MPNGPKGPNLVHDGPKGPVQIPDLLLCVGAQKSGTTWLYNRLAAHPETRNCSHKELHYFTAVHGNSLMGPGLKMRMMARMIQHHPKEVMRYLQAQAQGETGPRDVARVFRPMNDRWYAGLFTGPGRYAMDFTPEYAELNDAAHAHIKRLSTRCKVLFVMREPLDRALSAVRYVFKQSGRDIAAASPDEILAVAQKPVIARLSRYDQTVAMLQRHYPATDLRFLIYETMMSDKVATLQGLCDWLEIAPLELNSDALERRDNPTVPHPLPDAVIAHLHTALAPVRANIEASFPEAARAWAGVKQP